MERKHFGFWEIDETYLFEIGKITVYDFYVEW